MLITNSLILARAYLVRLSNTYLPLRPELRSNLTPGVARGLRAPARQRGALRLSPHVRGASGETSVIVVGRAADGRLGTWQAPKGQVRRR